MLDNVEINKTQFLSAQFSEWDEEIIRTQNGMYTVGEFFLWSSGSTEEGALFTFEECTMSR